MPTTRGYHQLCLRPLRSVDIDRSLRAVLGSVGYGVLLTDLDHTSLMCNERFGELWGIDSDAVVASDVARVREMVRHRVANLEAWERNLDALYLTPFAEQTDELILKDPHLVLSRNTRPVVDEDGSVVGRLWTFWDVTAEARQRQLDAALGRIASFQNPDPVAVCQFIADVVSQSFGSVALISILQHDFLRFHTSSGMPASAPKIEGNDLRESFCQFCLAAGHVFQVQNGRLDPRMIDLLPVRLGVSRYAGTPLRGADGAPVGTFCILDDRSHEAHSEAELAFLGVVGMRIEAELMRENHLGALRRNLATTTEELERVQARLIQNEKLAITGALAASVAHDIRNILASMQLQVEIGRDRPDEALRYVAESLSRFNVLAHRLMSYAKPRETQRHHVDLHEIAERVVALVAPQFAVSGVRLERERLCDACFVLGDDGRLEHLIVNLLINALNASSPGQVVRISVGLGRVVVSDDGKGIDPRVAETLFEPFVSSRKDGFGLGLYSCREIAREHEATIRVEPGTTGGTRFVVEFGGAHG